MDILRTVAILALVTAPMSAVRVSNSTNIEPAFKPEPPGRGTTSLLINCLATYFLCVWTAVHPDIIPNPTSLRTSLYKITLMVLSVFMAESTMLMAYGQWREARSVRKAWLDHFGLKKGKEGDIGMEGGFFVVMGGIAVGEIDQRGKTRTILTASGFKNYLAMGHIQETDLRKNSITDKGKAGMVVKLLVLIQAGWFVVAFFGRVATRFPVTLLEIHVVIQVFSALIAYCFWFYKPLDVNEPIHLDIPLSDWVHGTALPETIDYPDDLDFITEDARPSPLTVVLRAISVTGELMVRGNLNLFWVACLIAFNGACHAVAWLAQFPTITERTFWLTCSMSLCIVPFFAAFLLQYFGYLKRYYRLVWTLRFTHQTNIFSHGAEILAASVRGVCNLCAGKDTTWSPRGFVMAPWRLMMFCICAVLVTYYVACVGYIMGEAVASLRSLREGSYSTPVWSSYVPQIS